MPSPVQRPRVAGLEVEVRKGGRDHPTRQVLSSMYSHTTRVDPLWGVRGMEKGALDRGRSASFLGSTVRIIGPEDFIAMKLFAGSAKDLGDVQGVLEVSGKTLDLPLLKKVTRRYGVQETRRLASLLKKYVPMK